jgi:hypothetical protein
VILDVLEVTRLCPCGGVTSADLNGAGMGTRTSLGRVCSHAATVSRRVLTEQPLGRGSGHCVIQLTGPSGRTGPWGRLCL